jgi:hypothetical protein
LVYFINLYFLFLFLQICSNFEKLKLKVENWKCLSIKDEFSSLFLLLKYRNSFKLSSPLKILIPKLRFISISKITNLTLLTIDALIQTSSNKFSIRQSIDATKAPNFFNKFSHYRKDEFQAKIQFKTLNTMMSSGDVTQCILSLQTVTSASNIDKVKLHFGKYKNVF